MALDDIKQSVEQNLTNAYDKALDKGATEPENKNLENLASTIDSIIGGEVIGYSVKSVINDDGETQTLKITTGGGIRPEGTIVLETNGKHDVSQYEFAEVNVPSLKGNPIEVATDEEMANALTQANVGKVYKFTGTSSTYETDAIYIVSEVE